MRSVIAAGAAALLVLGCGGSSSNKSSGNGSSSGGSGSSSGSGGGGESCATMLSGKYLFHWSYVSGGATCQSAAPPDSAQDINPDAGVSMGGSDAGACSSTVTGCTFTSTCDSTEGDAGSYHVAESATVQSDGSITGTATIAYMISVGGSTISASCNYSLTATKQ